MKRIGVIDIGANSVRLLLSEIDDLGYYRIIDQLNTSIRICEDLIYNDIISEEKISKTLATLKSYKTLCDVSGVEKIYTVACDTIHRAQNKDEIIKKITNCLKLEVNFLTSQKECELIFNGVKSGLYIDSGLLVDIGGGSTHIIEYSDGEIKNIHALPIGSVNLSEKFSLKDRVTKESLQASEDFLTKLFSDCHWIEKSKAKTIIGVGGTIRALGKIDRLQKHYLLDISHNYKFNDMDFSSCYNLLKTKDLKQRKKVPGLSSERADIIIGGSMILKHIIEYLGEVDIVVSGNGVREGLIEKIIEPYKKEGDILDYSINGLINNLNLNKNHSEHIYSLTLSLFNQLKPLHHLGDEYINILKTACKLHDCGVSIDYYNHHKHSFYIILHSNLNGLNHKELLSAASLAAMHRNNSYTFPLPQFSFILNRLDLGFIEKLGVLLRICEGLDRTLVASVKGIDVKILDESVEFHLESNCCIHLEVNQAMRASKKFYEVYGRELIIKTNYENNSCNC